MWRALGPDNAGSAVAGRRILGQAQPRLVEGVHRPIDPASFPVEEERGWPFGLVVADRAVAHGGVELPWARGVELVERGQLSGQPGHRRAEDDDGDVVWVGEAVRPLVAVIRMRV